MSRTRDSNPRHAEVERLVEAEGKPVEVESPVDRAAASAVAALEAQRWAMQPGGVIRAWDGDA